MPNASLNNILNHETLVLIFNQHFGVVRTGRHKHHFSYGPQKKKKRNNMSGSISESDEHSKVLDRMLMLSVIHSVLKRQKVCARCRKSSSKI